MNSPISHALVIGTALCSTKRDGLRWSLVFKQSLASPHLPSFHQVVSVIYWSLVNQSSSSSSTPRPWRCRCKNKFLRHHQDFSHSHRKHRAYLGTELWSLFLVCSSNYVRTIEMIAYSIKSVQKAARCKTVGDRENNILRVSEKNAEMMRQHWTVRSVDRQSTKHT